MKENFDDILKRKWAEQHFTMDHQHRDEMIALLDKKKRRGIVPFWWISGVLLIGIVAAYVLWWTPSTNNIDHLKENVSNIALPLPETSSTGTSSQLVQQPDAYSQGKSQAEQSIVSNNNSSLTNDVRKEEKTSQNATSSQTKAHSVPSPGSHQNSSTSSYTPVVKGKTQKGKTPEQATTTPDYKDDIQSQVVDEKQKVTLGQHRIESSLDDFSIVAAPVPPTPEIRTPVNLLPIADLGISGISYSTDKNPSSTEAVINTKRSLFAFGETGFGLVMPSQPDFDAGFKLRAGAGLGYKVNPKIQFSLSAGYLLQAGGFDFQRSSTVDFAGFGTRSSFNTLTPDKLHFVYTRLGVQYRIQRHLIGMHAGFQYLYGAQGQVVTQVQDQFAPVRTETSAYAWLVTDGLRRWNWTMDLSYGYQIAPRWSVMAGADFYFSNITIENPGLSNEGYYWKGAYASIHPFLTLNYLIYAGR